MAVPPAGTPSTGSRPEYDSSPLRRQKQCSTYQIRSGCRAHGPHTRYPHPHSRSAIIEWPTRARDEIGPDTDSWRHLEMTSQSDPRRDADVEYRGGQGSAGTRCQQRDAESVTNRVTRGGYGDGCRQQVLPSRHDTDQPPCGLGLTGLPITSRMLPSANAR